MKLYELSLSQASAMLGAGQISSVELTKAIIERQEKTEPVLNCYITSTPELALEDARRADELIKKGKASPLTGVPIGLKDSICTEGVRTTAGSRMLHNFVPPYDSTINARLKAAGAIMLGKHNLDEFAMGSTTETSFFGPTKNPWDLNAIPGGSSGGSAASLAAGSCLGAVGSDTGGSIRQPASHCGVVGLKPTYGLVSRSGVIGFASSLDQAGPLGRSVEDVALLLNCLAGYDEKDQTSLPYKTPDYTGCLQQDIKGVRIGMPEEYFTSGLAPEVESALKRAVDELAIAGALIVPISLPRTEYLISTYYIIAAAEASSNLGRYDGVKFGFSADNITSLEQLYLKTRTQGFGPEVIRRVGLGAYVLSSGYYDAYYTKAGKVRTLIIEDFEKAFEQVDVIAAPSAPHAALDLGCSAGDPLTVYLRDIYTVSCNLTGMPAISLPAGFSDKGRPIGLQLMAPRFGENVLLALGAAFQKNTGFHLARPNIVI